MADESCFVVLRQGVDAWNRWREANSGMQPDLSEARLSNAAMSRDLPGINLRGAVLTEAKLVGMNLQGANLHATTLDRVDLRGTTLFQADLSGASLEYAKLSLASLREANLSRANLYHADLTGSDLLNAELSGANLRRTILSGARMVGTKLTAATVGNTIFGSVCLSYALGLDSLNHAGPSTLGVDSIIHSKGQIPKVFLRGSVCLMIGLITSRRWLATPSSSFRALSVTAARTRLSLLAYMTRYNPREYAVGWMRNNCYRVTTFQEDWRKASVCGINSCFALQRTR